MLVLDHIDRRIDEHLMKFSNDNIRDVWLLTLEWQEEEKKKRWEEKGRSNNKKNERERRKRQRERKHRSYSSSMQVFVANELDQ